MCLIKHHAMKTYEGVEVELNASAALTPGKRLRYSLGGRLGGPQRWSGRCGEEKKSLLMVGIQSRSSNS
jgi:hypothetical protein